MWAPRTHAGTRERQATHAIAHTLQRLFIRRTRAAVDGCAPVRCGCPPPHADSSEVVEACLAAPDLVCATGGRPPVAAHGGNGQTPTSAAAAGRPAGRARSRATSTSRPSSFWSAWPAARAVQRGGGVSAAPASSAPLLTTAAQSAPPRPLASASASAKATGTGCAARGDSRRATPRRACGGACGVAGKKEHTRRSRRYVQVRIHACVLLSCLRARVGSVCASRSSQRSFVCLFVCLFVLATPGMPAVALLPQGRLSQGATQSIPGLRLKKLGAALPLALW